MRNAKVKEIALGGMLAAVALVIMCLGGMIPLATYICPMLCTITQFIVLRFCGKRIAWVWYCAVALLGLLAGPDKEAAGVFLLLGYYPIIKPMFDRSRLHWLWKLLLFNGAVIVLYKGLLYLLGMSAASSEFEQFGYWGLVVMLILGNTVFFLLDRVLTMMWIKFRK